jgi:hypothetical protein
MRKKVKKYFSIYILEVPGNFYTLVIKVLVKLQSDFLIIIL